MRWTQTPLQINAKDAGFMLVIKNCSVLTNTLATTTKKVMISQCYDCLITSAQSGHRGLNWPLATTIVLTIVIDQLHFFVKQSQSSWAALNKGCSDSARTVTAASLFMFVPLATRWMLESLANFRVSVLARRFMSVVATVTLPEIGAKWPTL